MRLDLVVGSNGAGKSTFIDLTLSRVLPRTAFVNADEIAKREWPDDPETHSYEAADIARRTRSALIARRDAFIAETVFSHVSKLDLITEAHTAGYTLALHVLLVPEELTVARVAQRVANGGHSVPINKIRERYERVWPLVVRAITMVDSAAIYDNSDIAGPHEIARFSGGHLIGAAAWPAWSPEPLRLLS